ncbi:MAG: hypothetical protein DRP97_00760 [Candidatus Latescibacterota bacterium]|nr:MAG: hypothetical protein DRP97_00760 [Candidatus Latescibacterota bacterium]
MSIKKKLIRNTVANYTIRFWEIIIGLILFPFIVHHIGLSAAGIWLLVSSITGYFGLLDLGIGASLVKHVAEYHAKRDDEKLSDSINTTFFIFLGMGLIASVGLFIVGRFFITSFNIPQELVEEARAITYIAAVTTLIGFPLGTFGGVLRGLQRYDLSALVGFIVSIPRVILTVFFLLRGYGVVTLVLINTFCSMMGWLLSVYYSKKLLPFAHISPSNLNKEVTRKLLGLAGAVFFIHVCVMILFRTDQLVIGLFMTVGIITYYAAAWKVYDACSMVPGLVMSAIMPASSELDANRDFHSLQIFLIRATRYSIALFIPFGVFGIVLAKPTLVFWMGDDFGQYHLITQILVLHLFFNFNHHVASQILIGMNKVKGVLYYYGIVAVLNIVLSIILVQRIGLVGVALGTTIPFVLFEVFFVQYFLKTLKLSWKTYAKEVLLKTYPIGVCVAPLLYLLTIFYPPHNLIEVLGFGMLTFGTCLFLFYIFSLKKTEKEEFKQMVVAARSQFGLVDSNKGGSS